MTANDNLTPRERLAKIVAEETGDGRRIVRFFVQVAEGQRDNEDFKACHRMDAAKELVKIGLTEFSDYIQTNAAPRKPRSARKTGPNDADISPEIAQAREQLAAYARELTQDGRTVIRMYAEVMEGARNDEGFKPHHRIAAARELIKRGFDETYTQPMPDVRPESTDESAEPTTENCELNTENSEPVDYVAMAKEIVANLDLPELPEEPPSSHKPDLSMWEIIKKQPNPVITEEHARIGAARFREAIERQRLWEESDVKIPPKPDFNNYDDR